MQIFHAASGLKNTLVNKLRKTVCMFVRTIDKRQQQYPKQSFVLVRNHQCCFVALLNSLWLLGFELDINRNSFSTRNDDLYKTRI